MLIITIEVKLNILKELKETNYKLWWISYFATSKDNIDEKIELKFRVKEPMMNKKVNK